MPSNAQPTDDQLTGTPDGADEQPSESESRKYWRPAPALPALGVGEAAQVIEHLYFREKGRLRAHELATARGPRTSGHYADPDQVRAHLDLVRALMQAGRLTFAEYVCQAGSACEGVVDHRFMQGLYEDIEEISGKLAAIEVNHGLKFDEWEYWSEGNAPAEYDALDTEWNAAYDAKFPEVMREFGENELADLYANQRDRYDALREEGRRSVFEKENLDTALATLVVNYEDEAKRCGEAGAHLAGCLMWGAAAEARLLLRCVRDPDGASAAREKLPRERRPKKTDPASWTLEQLVHVAAEAGWLGTNDQDGAADFVRGLVERLRRTRNLIHPGRHAQERPHVRLDQTFYDDARAAYFVMSIFGDRPPQEPSPREITDVGDDPEPTPAKKET